MIAIDSAIIFKLLNMLAVVALITYVFRRCVLPVLRHTFKHNQETATQKNATIRDLKQTTKDAADILVKEQQTVQRLKSAVTQWHMNVKDHALLEQEKQSALKKIIEDQLHQRLMTSALKKERARIMTHAIKGAEQALKDYFSNNAPAARTYNETIIDYVQKS